MGLRHFYILSVRENGLVVFFPDHFFYLRKTVWKKLYTNGLEKRCKH